MMFKKRIKENANKHFDELIKDPSFIKTSPIKKSPIRYKWIPILSSSLAVTVIGVVTLSIVLTNLNAKASAPVNYGQGEASVPMNGGGEKQGESTQTKDYGPEDTGETSLQPHLLNASYTQEGVISRSNIFSGATLIGSASGLQTYLQKMNSSYTNEEIMLEVGESFFDNNTLLGISFLCTSDELNKEGNYDGEGVKVDGFTSNNNELIIQISVPTGGMCEDINQKLFFAKFAKEDVASISKYTYDVTQRDNGAKGSYYYH